MSQPNYSDKGPSGYCMCSSVSQYICWNMMSMHINHKMCHGFTKNWWWIVLVYGFTGLHVISNILLTAYHSGLRVYRFTSKYKFKTIKLTSGLQVNRFTSNFKFKTINSGLQVYRFTSNFKFNYEFLFIGLQVISNSVLIYRFTGFHIAL